MSNIIPFQFNNHEIVAIVDEQGNPWWKASDVCEQCGIKNVSQACERLDADEKANIILNDVTGRPREILVVNESGFYALTLRSRKPQTKAFRRWVTHDVLPQVRKTGKFEMAPQVKNPANQMLIEAIMRLDAVEQQAQQAQLEAAEARAEAAQANANALLALQSQLFQTVAEYVYINKLQRQVPEPWYRALSDHLRLYCRDRNIPFHKVAVEGKRWQYEWTYLQSVYVELLPGWLKHRYAQGNLTILHPPQEGDPA